MQVYRWDQIASHVKKERHPCALHRADLTHLIPVFILDEAEELSLVSFTKYIEQTKSV